MFPGMPAAFFGGMDNRPYILDWLHRTLIGESVNDNRIAYVSENGDGPFGECEWTPPVRPGERLFLGGAHAGRSPDSCNVSVHTNHMVGAQRNFEDLTGEVDLRQLNQGVLEQVRLHTEAHEAVRHVYADQAGMAALPLHQRSEIRRVVRYEHVSVPDRAPDEEPVLPGPQPEPTHVRRFRKPPFSGDGHECGAKTFVDEKLHRLGGSSRKSTSLDMIGFRLRQKGPRRGRPRRG